MSTLKKGIKAPDFSGTDQTGARISLSSYRGKKVILYFYPKDDTPGCTAEACNLRDNFHDLRAKGFEVIGVSPDDQYAHEQFISKYDLPFTLISDPDKEILNAYNAWGTKSMYGRSFEGVLRKTYVLDEEGTILAVFNKVNTGDHSRQILEELNQQYHG